MDITSERIIKEIVNKNFTWGDLNPKYDNVAQLKTNVMCMFHDHNYTEGNAKFYYDEEKDIWTLFCFVEKKVFTAYEYLKLVVCEKWQKYNSPLQFLKERLPEGEILRQYKLIEEQTIDEVDSAFNKKKEYIDNVYSETGNTIDYIEELYTA